MRREDEGVVGGVTRDWREENVLGYCFIAKHQGIPLLICRRSHGSRVYSLFSGMRGGCLGHGQGSDGGRLAKVCGGFLGHGWYWIERERVDHLKEML